MGQYLVQHHQSIIASDIASDCLEAPLLPWPCPQLITYSHVDVRHEFIVVALVDSYW